MTECKITQKFETRTVSVPQILAFPLYIATVRQWYPVSERTLNMFANGQPEDIYSDKCIQLLDMPKTSILLTTN